MKKTITTKTADLILDALTFQAVYAMKNGGLSEDAIVNMTDEIYEHARKVFIAYCKAENIIGVTDEFNVIDEEE